MEITKINGEEIKIGKTSITIKGDNSKTIGVIIKMYNETAEALEQADREYNNDKKNTKRREVYRYVAAQEAVLNDLCYELEIDDLIDDGLNDEEA